MASCYKCGCYIRSGKGYRRQVQTGQSSGVSLGKRASSSFRTYYGTRTLCTQCTNALDIRALQNWIGCLAIAAILITFIAYL